jgi:hypothetical protein
MLMVELGDDEHRALKLLAVRRGTSMSRIVRSLVAAELAAGLTDEDRMTAARWTPESARAALGVGGESDLAIREQIHAAMAAAERRAETIYGESGMGAA